MDTNIKLITLKALATELGLDKSNLRKFVIQHGIGFINTRVPESRGQQVLALKREDAELVRNLRKEQGFDYDGRVVTNVCGYFYIIQLAPDLSNQRTKFGFASNVDQRLSAHRTVAPTAKLIKTWPCKSSWERAAIECATKTNAVCIMNEVYDCDNLDIIIKRCESFFELMPEIK